MYLRARLSQSPPRSPVPEIESRTLGTLDKFSTSDSYPKHRTESNLGSRQFILLLYVYIKPVDFLKGSWITDLPYYTLHESSGFEHIFFLILLQQFITYWVISSNHAGLISYLPHLFLLCCSLSQNKFYFQSWQLINTLYESSLFFLLCQIWVFRNNCWTYT